MAELRLTMTAEARNVLTDLLRLIAPAAARVSVNRAKIPDGDAEVASFWTDTLSSQAAEEARLLATAFANAKGEPAVIVLKNDGQAFAFLRALSAVRIALRELVFADIPDAALEGAEMLGLLLLLWPAATIANTAARPRGVRVKAAEIG
ncbi:MAG: hypothetical protein RL492_1828 [Verrucomicrobiota bacterium]